MSTARLQSRTFSQGPLRGFTLLELVLSLSISLGLFVVVMHGFASWANRGQLDQAAAFTASYAYKARQNAVTTQRHTALVLTDSRPQKLSLRSLSDAELSLPTTRCFFSEKTLVEPSRALPKQTEILTGPRQPLNAFGGGRGGQSAVALSGLSQGQASYALVFSPTGGVVYFDKSTQQWKPAIHSDPMEQGCAIYLGQRGNSDAESQMIYISALVGAVTIGP